MLQLQNVPRDFSRQAVRARGLAGLTSTELGRRYEENVISLLVAYGATLHGTGGAGDRGIDFEGVWRLSSAGLSAGHRTGHAIRLLFAGTGTEVLPVVGQCKATTKPVGTSTMRDFQQSVSGSLPSTLAVLACSGGFAWRDLQVQRSMIVRHTLLLHVQQGGALKAARLLPSDEALRAGHAPPAFIVQQVPAAGGLGQGVRRPSAAATAGLSATEQGR